MESKPQNYEDYWKITLEYSDINGERFIGTLKIIVDFINKNKKKHYSPELFSRLQKQIYKVYKKNDMASVRKSINQFVKLGFINFQLKSYHEDTINFLEAKTNRRRKSIFSKIVYTNSSFNRSVTTNSDDRQINFLIKTLEEVGSLSHEEIIALMTTKINEIAKGYLNKIELDRAKKKTKKIKFFDRKYNQAGHLNTILKRLDDLIFVNGVLYFEDDAQDQFGKYLSEIRHIRDAYLYRLYKNQLKEETSEKLGEEKCMVENLDYPSLVASHIKPFIKSSKKEAYHPNNGLLLSRNMDILFDRGFISFDAHGKMLLSGELSQDLQEHLKGYALKEIFLNSQRIRFLKYHRKYVFKA